jgi:hypothetical protein
MICDRHLVSATSWYQTSSFRPKLLTPSVSSAVEKSAVAFHQRRFLLLPLLVSAVILSAAKDPEDLH